MKKLLLVFIITFSSCSNSGSGQDALIVPEENDNPNNLPEDNNPDNPNTNLSWSIPQAEVFDGGPGKDGIPALEEPSFFNTENASYLDDEDLVIGVRNGTITKAYPHLILDWHEIVNDAINDEKIAITYCPLTGTGIGWSRIINDKTTTFGVSGLLYNTNLIPYDRATDSNWSQILNECVNGELIGEKPEQVDLIETNWKTWKTLYPNTLVLDNVTGFSRPYGSYPYGSYKTNNDLFLFPVPKDERLPLKERIHAIIDGEKAKVYRFSHFNATNLILDYFNGEPYLIVGNEDFIISFQLNAPLATLNYEYVYDGSEILLTDNEGNLWNVFGEAISGPQKGTFLDKSFSFMAFWFSIPAFYTTDIYLN